MERKCNPTFATTWLSKKDRTRTWRSFAVAYARAGLIGNPSDGYNGKTIAVLVPNYFAEVVLYEWKELEIVPSQDDQSKFSSIENLATDVQLHGYYGGIRLVKATIKRFLEYCQGRHELHDRNFSIRYESSIPRTVGMAGSSGIIVATLRALMDFYDLEIPIAVQPSLVLSVEQQELGIEGGLQDRVVQCFGEPVYMDFSVEAMHESHGLMCGQYSPVAKDKLPPLYVAFDQSWRAHRSLLTTICGDDSSRGKRLSLQPWRICRTDRQSFR